MIDIRIIDEPLDYAEGLTIQRDTQTAILDDCGPETLLLLEHQPVYTIGKRRDQSSLRDPSSLPAPLYEINRGGQATYHGPGQLVGYAILDLRQRGRDLHHHLRTLEESLILTCRDFGIAADRHENMTGVWVENRKLASIGVGVTKWISMHGFAINITPECLMPFFAITPCGLDGVTMTCVEHEAKRPVSIAEFRDSYQTHFAQTFATTA